MTTWHAPPDLLARYARHPAAIDDTTASSVEEHLLACADCRAALAGTVEPADVERSWLAVVDVVDRPPAGLLERLLTRAGVAGDTARLVGATGGLQVTWFGVVVLLAVLAVTTADARGAAWPFLVLAPILPVGAVALAFLPIADPAGESGVATPLHGLGVTIRRVLATTLPTLLLLLVATPLLPGDRASSAAWVLPALALAAASLVLATVVRIPIALGIATAGWFLTLWALRLGEHRVRLDETSAFGAPGQVVSLVVLAVAVLGLVARRDRFATLEVGW